MYRNLHVRESKKYNKKEYSILNYTGTDMHLTYTLQMNTC